LSKYPIDRSYMFYRIFGHKRLKRVDFIENFRSEFLQFTPNESPIPMMLV